MFKLIKSKKAVALVAVVIAIAIGAVGAYAYFTSTGSGSATGAVGTRTALTVNGTLASTLYPGTDSNVAFTVINSDPGIELINTIKLAEAEGCAAGTTWNTATSLCSDGAPALAECSGVGYPGAFEMTSVSEDAAGHPGAGEQLFGNATYGLGSPQSLALNTPSGSIHYNNLGNQDDCINANLWFRFTSN